MADIAKKYFRLKASFERKIVGDFPQLQEGIYSGAWDSKNALGMLNFQKATPNTEIPSGKLTQKAKLTDLLSVSFLNKPLISDRLKLIIEQSIYEGIEFLATDIVVKDKSVEGYWFINPFEAGYKYLDLEQSGFQILSDSIKMIPLKDCKFSNAQEVKIAFQENQVSAINNGIRHTPLYITHICLKENVEIDFFALQMVLGGGIGYFVSERLREKIEKAECSGVEFTTLN